MWFNWPSVCFVSVKFDFKSSSTKKKKKKDVKEAICYFSYFFFFWWSCGLNSVPTPRATPPALFCAGYFRDRVPQTIYLGWLQTVTLLICASWVARITGVSTGAQLLQLFLSSAFLHGGALRRIPVHTVCPRQVQVPRSWNKAITACSHLRTSHGKPHCCWCWRANTTYFAVVISGVHSSKPSKDLQGTTR
jgi:hypothetical protein